MLIKKMEATKFVFAVLFTVGIASVPLSAQHRSPVAPREELLKAAVNDAYQKFKSDGTGKNADYIPYLAHVDSKLFGIAVVTTDNKSYTLGDLTYAFSIQSISKVFTLALAMEELGVDKVFERVGKVNSGGVPYPLFSYIGLLPWTFFQSSMSTGGLSLVNQPLLNKVYAPREVFPLSEVVTGAVGAGCATIALAFLFLFEGRAPSATSYWAIPLIVILVAFIVACTLLASSVTVYFRDLRHALPLVLQLGLFVTPVVYGLNEIPRSFRAAYVALNPLGGVIDGYRGSPRLAKSN